MRVNPPCKFDSCGRPTRSRGTEYCGSHYAQEMAGKRLRPLREYAKKDTPRFPCGVSDCGDLGVSGYCTKHLAICWRMGIHPEELDGLYKDGCQICGTHKNLCVDHDHQCCPTVPACGSCVRGVLCSNCNTRVGFFETQPLLNDKTWDYVKRSQRLNLRKREARAPKPKPPLRGPKTEWFAKIDAKGRICVKQAGNHLAEFKIFSLPNGAVELRPVAPPSIAS